MEIDEKHYPFILEDFDIRTKSYFHLKFDIAFSLISSSEISYCKGSNYPHLFSEEESLDSPNDCTADSLLPLYSSLGTN